jgi:hypothetical protein
MYSPIEYRNGALKITKMSPYKGIPSTDVIKAGNMEFDGLPTLRLIMRMYKKAVKKAGQDAYPDENLDEVSYEEEAVDPLRDYKQATEQVTEGKTRVNNLFAALDAKGFSSEQIQDTAFLAKKIDNIMWTLDDVADNPEELAKRYQDRVSSMSEESNEDLEETADTEADKNMVRKFMTMYETEPSKFEKLHKQAQTQASTTKDIKFKHLLSLIDRAKAGALQALSNQDKRQADSEGMDEDLYESIEFEGSRESILNDILDELGLSESDLKNPAIRKKVGAELNKRMSMQENVFESTSLTDLLN